MESKKYLDNILELYKNSFDIIRNYDFEGNNFSAYGYFNSKAEKYILVKEVNLWEVNSFEHIFFIELDNLTEDTFKTYEKLLKEKLESRFIRNGNKYPEKNHITSFLSLVFISSSPINENLIKKIEKFSFEKTYLFSIRGFLTTKVIGVDLKNKKVYYNKPAKDLKEVYEKSF